MKKYLSLIVAVFALLCLSTPSHANNPWEGTFSKASKQGNVWVASVTIRKTGQKVTKYFAECRKVSGGYECRNQVDGSGVSAGVTDSNNYVADGDTTRYAVFHPRHFPRYVPAGRGNIWNIDAEPQMRQACSNAGSHCIIVVAPLHNWEAAKQIARQQTNWPL